MSLDVALLKKLWSNSPNIKQMLHFITQQKVKILALRSDKFGFPELRG